MLTMERFGPATTTAVFDAYWTFASERQAIYFRRLRGEQPPWTDDEILSQYRFTNAYRAADRVSQFLIRHVIYAGDCSSENILFRTLLFKLFNKVETWGLLHAQLGSIDVNKYRFADYDQVLSDAMNSGTSIYSSAYIMPSANREFGEKRKHRGHLRLIERMLGDGLSDKVARAGGLEEVFELLIAYPTIGSFLAYQLATDLNYSPLCDFDENEFVVPGPGAIDGISKCFSDVGRLSPRELIVLVTRHQQDEFERRSLPFETLGGRSLRLIDCQNLFCEISKYSRVSHPKIAGVSGRKKIKQKFDPAARRVSAWFPPKWGINKSIKEQIGRAR